MLMKRRRLEKLEVGLYLIGKTPWKLKPMM
jgi:hypothetical protein